MTQLVTSHNFIPLLFVISAPSGTGKSTLMQMLKKQLGDRIEQVISCTTRNPRLEEKDGIDYHFIDVRTFKRFISEDQFLEYEVIFDEFYGIKREEVFKIFRKKKHAFALIDTKGALNIRKKILNTVLIFLAPPSQEEQLKRLKYRNSESVHQIDLRLKKTINEFDEAKNFTYYVVNDNLGDTCNVVQGIIVAEEHRLRRKNEQKEQ